MTNNKRSKKSESAAKKTTGDPLCNADWMGKLCTRENHDDGFHSYDFDKPQEIRTSSSIDNERCEGYVDNSRCQRVKGHPGACRIFRRFDNSAIPMDGKSLKPFILN